MFNESNHQHFEISPSDARPSKSKIRTLLECLAVHGIQDAEQLERRTGFSKSLIVATLFGACGRGLVASAPRRDFPNYGTPEKRTSKRGCVYTFLSYEAPPSLGLGDDSASRSCCPPELLAYAELALYAGARQSIEQFDQCCERRLQKNID